MMMGRCTFLVLLAFAATLLNVHSFTPAAVARPASSFTTTRLYDADRNRFVERGVSVDQDGKSNVWAIEPKVEVEQKSSEEQSTSALIAVGGIAVLGAAAAFILTNLPDPNQF